MPEPWSLFPEAPKSSRQVDRTCPNPCRDCPACFWHQGGHHWVEIDRDAEVSDYECRNCGKASPAHAVWLEEVGRGDERHWTALEEVG